MVIVGIVLVLLHVLGDKLIKSRRIVLCVPIVFCILLASSLSRIGIIMSFISVFSVVTANCLDSFIYNQRNKNQVEEIGIILVTAIFLLICIIKVCLFSKEDNAVWADVTSSFLVNLYGTSRYTAFPLLDINIMILIGVHVCIYCLYKKRVENESLFWSITLSVLTYLVVIYFLYVFKLSDENIQAYGEYMTGFERYMIIPTALIYGGWINIYGAILAKKMYILGFKEN